MNAIKVETTVDEAMVRAVPALRPLLGQRVELIALETQRDASAAFRPRVTVEELFAAAVKPPPGTPPLTEQDIQRAIVEGALRGNI